MFERKIYQTLLEWKNREHKCLVVKGQRQIGKTFIIETFAKAEYEHYVYINFDDSPELKDLFEGDTTAAEMIKKLTLRFGADSIVDGSTLLFIDEIQECERAYSSLKQFSIYGKIDVIAASSSMEVKTPWNERNEGEQESLVPLGYHETVVMHPVDFEEFLWAIKIPKDSIDEIRSYIRDRKPIENVLFDRITKLFREYAIVGGMPEAVETYVSTDDFRPVFEVQKKIYATCKCDIARYNKGIDRIKTTECFESIPYQLAESNKKFMYSRIKGGKSRRSSDRYTENLLWIKNAGYGVFCYGLEQPALPLKRYVIRDSFKVYMSDTGMLLSSYGDKAKMAVYQGDCSYNMGAVAENIVASEMFKCGLEPMYYRKDKGEGRMELDFVLEFWDGVAVIEVKSGKDRSAPSLKKVGSLFDVARGIMLENGNIRVDEDGIEHYPMFACAFMREMDRPPEGPRFS